MFKAIACINSKNAIGKDGNLLYHIPSDLRNFMRMTTRNVVVMGKKTFLSLPHSSPLKNRVNVIITHDEDFSIDQNESTYIVHSVEDAVELCETLFSDKEWFVIGGASIYKEFIDKGLVDEMRLTTVEDDADGDVYFPTVTNGEWITYYESNEQSDDGTIKFKFKVLKKIS